MKIDSNTANLFSSLGGSQETSNLLSDYASIKNGSYKKLMKAYYGKQQGSVSKAEAESKNDTVTKNLTAVKTQASEFKSATEAISKAIEDGDADKIAKAVTDFADKYNSFVEAADKAGKTSFTRTAQNMINEVGANLKLLSTSGIKLSDKNKMSVDEETVKKNISSLKSLFGGVGSFGDQMASKASSIENKATSALNSQKTYNRKADYDNSIYNGKLYDTFN